MGTSKRQKKQSFPVLLDLGLPGIEVVVGLLIFQGQRPCCFLVNLHRRFGRLCFAHAIPPATEGTGAELGAARYVGGRKRVTCNDMPARLTTVASTRDMPCSCFHPTEYLCCADERPATLMQGAFAHVDTPLLGRSAAEVRFPHVLITSTMNCRWGVGPRQWITASCCRGPSRLFLEKPAKNGGSNSQPRRSLHQRAKPFQTG